ncbi:hypothetical protein PRIPAC_78608 [Pristionchus pacificus]|uniref:Uncharacterized protein n=1 Tax=Pristionchus pacificus TaxID=54126 RepID=A0A2A6C1Y5_PRIPA|nr:hypothetical protein PRIPAC_78608 [Pristionchus pacificus]|eukprot:PDM72119.1 hypothetical protein PRIPAC_38553 [Pristionchus pacificus]
MVTHPYCNDIVSSMIIMYAWSSAFLIGIIAHVMYIVTDFMTTFLPLRNIDPPVRLTILSLHGFSHVMSSTQEFLFATDRAMASSYPRRYHDGSIAVKSLLFGEALSLTCAFVYMREIYLNRLFSGFLLTTTIDCASLLCLALTSIHIRNRVRSISSQSLNVKYQLRETSEITNVMLQCGVVSLLTKLCAMFLAWTAVYRIISVKYAFTIAGGGYLIIETTNCFICCTALLLNHRGFRKQTLKLFGRGTPPQSTEQSGISVRDMYFSDLRRVWN